MRLPLVNPLLLVDVSDLKRSSVVPVSYALHEYLHAHTITICVCNWFDARTMRPVLPLHSKAVRARDVGFDTPRTRESISAEIGNEE